MNSANAGRRTLVGFDGRRVVVRFDFKGYGKVVADIDQTGVFFPCTGQKGSAVSGQGF